MPAVCSWNFLLLYSEMASMLCFSFLFWYEAVSSQLEGPSLLSLWSSTIKMETIPGNWEWTEKQFVSFLTYSVLIQHFSLFLSVSPSFLFFLSYFLQCSGLCFLISKTKNPSADIFHFIKYLEQVTGVTKETVPKPSCQQIPIPGAGWQL